MKSSNKILGLLEPFLTAETRTRESNLRYIIAIICPVLAFILYQFLPPDFRGLHFFLLYPTVFLIANLLGFGPGLTATLISAVLVYYYIIPTQNSFVLENYTDLLPTALFVLMGTGISIIAGHLKHVQSELKNAVVARDEFISIASHELRTPITSLRMQLQITQKSLDPESGITYTTERLARSVTSSLKQVDRLTKMVEDLLDISKIQAGKLNLNFEIVDLVKLTKNVIERHQEDCKAAKCAVELNAAESVQVQCDPTRIEQVISNLLLNSVKYGAGKPIIVGVFKINATAAFSVQDFGIGISQDMQEKIFKRFERAVSHNSISGWGLGLFIAKQVVQAHHGEIRVESQPDIGSTFTFQIPLQQLDTHKELNANA